MFRGYRRVLQALKHHHKRCSIITTSMASIIYTTSFMSNNEEMNNNNNNNTNHNTTTTPPSPTTTPSIIEEYTKHEYDSHMCVWFQAHDVALKHQLQLCGVGIRCMMNMCFIPQARAYSLGLYYNSRECMEVIQRLTHDDDGGGCIHAPLPKYGNANSDFEKLVLNGDLFSKALRIVFNNTIAGSHLGKGWGKALNARLSQVIRDGQVTDDEQIAKHRASVDKLVSVTSRINVGAGDEFIFSWQAEENTVLLSINGTGVTVIEDPFVSWALFDYYFGVNPVAPDAKEHIEEQWTRQVGSKRVLQQLLTKGQAQVV